MTLERALQRAADSVDALVEAWRLNPHPRLSAVASQLPTSELFASLFTGKLAQIADKLQALEVRRHPHLSNELERILRDPPWSSDLSRPVWEQIFALVTESKDPRFLALAAELPASWGMRTPQKRWLTRALTAAVASIPAAVELTNEQSALLQVIERDAFAAKPPSKRSPTIDFGAVYENPRADGPRLVLADALLEQGDERGEFMSLQLRPQKTPSEVKREKALLKANAKRWLAPFGGTLGAEVEWRRGFPAEGDVKFRDAAAAEKYGAIPEWATFESLSWLAPRSPEHREAAGFIGPAFRHLLRADAPFPAHLLEGSWALEWLRCEVASRDQFFSLLAHRGLSHLTTLHLLNTELDEGWISSVNGWGAVEELGVPRNTRSPLIHLLAAAEKSSLARLQWSESLRFHREADGAMTRLELLRASLGVGSQLSSLPEGLVTSFVTPPSAEWTAGHVGRELERVSRTGEVRPSIARAARRHLDLHSPHSIALSGDRVFVSDLHTIREVDLLSLEVLASFSGRGGWLDPSGRETLSLRNQQQVVVHELASATERLLLEGESLSGLTRSADGTRAAVEQSREVFVLDVASGRVVFTCEGAEPALDSRGERLTVRTRAGCVLHDLRKQTHEVLERVGGRRIFLPDGRVANREGGDRVCVWRKPGDAFSLDTAHDPAWALLATADGSRLVLVQPSMTRVFDARARVLSELPGGDCALLAPDGWLCVATSSALLKHRLP